MTWVGEGWFLFDLVRFDGFEGFVVVIRYLSTQVINRAKLASQQHGTGRPQSTEEEIDLRRLTGYWAELKLVVVYDKGIVREREQSHRCTKAY